MKLAFSPRHQCLTEFSLTSLLYSSEDATPEAPVFAASKSSKAKTHKAHKAKSVKSWKSKGSKAEARDADIDSMLEWWSGVAFNKDGSSQSDIAMNLENGSSRSRSLRIGSAVAIILGALACL